MRVMSDTHETPAKPDVGYDSEVRDKIELLLDELRAAETPEAKSPIYTKLDQLIFGIDRAED